MRSVFLFALVGLLAAPVLAQSGTFGRYNRLETTGTSYRVFTQPNQATIQVLVMGNVGSTGVYEIAEGTDLAQLIALTGAQLAFDGREATSTVRLYRGREGARAVIYEASLRETVERSSGYPPLVEGDVLELAVRERKPFGWREGLQVLTSISTIVILVDRVFLSR